MSDAADRYREAGWWTGESLVDRFWAHVRAQPHSRALVCADASMSRRELWDAAGLVAEGLVDTVGDGRRVVVLHLPNEIAWMVMFLATLRSGHVPATIPVTTSAEHLRHVIDLTDAALVVSSAQHRGRSPVDTALQAAKSAELLPAVATASETMWTQVSRREVSVTVADVAATTAHLMFTSSTTGPPKAVSHSEDSLATLNRQFADRFHLDETTPVFMPSPLGHSVGAIHGARLALYLGTALVVQDEWNPDEALRIVADQQATFTAASTPFLLDLLNAPWAGPGSKLTSLRTFVCGGAQVPPALIRRCRAEFPDTFVTPLWGMTEGGVTTCVHDTPPELVEATVGVGLPDLELQVLDSTGTAHREGEGELAMRGPGVFNGYYGQPHLYEVSTTHGGYFRTGDLACIDAAGYVSITGRVKDLIIRGGVNISPVDTENTVAAHPDILAVAVIGWPDERLGERLCAVVETTAPIDLEQILAFCEVQGLERRHWPEQLRIVDSFPRTAAGKIRKQDLRDQLLSGANGSAP